MEAAAAKTLVSNIGQLVGDEFRKLRGVGGEVARLRNELATINALHRMQSEADEAAVSHFVREWMKQLREVGYDAEDCVDLYLFRVRSRQGDRFFVRWKRLLGTLWARRRLAGDISDLRSLAAAINENHARYGGVSLESRLGRSTAAASDPAVLQQAVAESAAARPPLALRPPAADNHDDRSYRFVDNKAVAVDLANKVKALGNDDDKKLKVFSIVGFGGLGKTTLALEVCRLLEAEFPCQAKVSVSQTLSGKDLEGLLKRLLRQIIIAQTKDDPLDKIDTMDASQLENKLKESLDNNRYLILIDDVWSTPAWDVIRSKLPSSNCGSRIIVTTRMDNVAKACSDTNNDYVHHMKKLDDKDSEELFVSKAFGSVGNPRPNDEDFKGTMRSILKKCGGLPLAIVSIGSLLGSYKLPEGKEMWNIVQRSIGSQMEINPTLEGMRQILMLSYNNLPHHLKACMMYLSIFPEDYMISKDRLLKRWIAEGLVAEKRGLTRMELAEGYFYELMSRSMIDQATDFVETDGRRQERCKVHDMMLEILVSTSLEANFVSLTGGQYEGLSYTNMIRRLSIHGKVEAAAHKDSSSSKKNVIQGMMVEHVRSLSIFDPQVNTRLLARLGELTLLRVLDLEGCEGLGTKPMNCICRMYLLRFLSLRGTDIKVMPRGVGDLEHLQTLDVRETDLKDLPDTVTKLEKLEHLLFSNKGISSYKLSGWMMPQGINKMTSLRQVNRAVIQDPEVAEEIGELDQLQELGIYVDTRSLFDENVDTRKQENNLVVVLEKLACSLSKMYSLRWLDMGNFGCGKWPFVPIMGFLHLVESPPRLLRYLKIWGHIDRLPDWVGSLTDLVEFDISWTYLNGDDLFNVICELPNLKRLSLGAYFIRHYQDMVARSSQTFPNLKELTLGYSPEVPEVYTFEEGSMSKLETLVVNFGDQGKTIVGVEHLTNLKEVQYNGLRSHPEMKGSHLVEQLEKMNNKPDLPNKQITVKARYI